MYRTHITWNNSALRVRLDNLGIMVLEETVDSAIVPVDDAQLEDLARLRFGPRASDELGSLLSPARAAHTTKSTAD